MSLSGGTVPGREDCFHLVHRLGGFLRLAEIPPEDFQIRGGQVFPETEGMRGLGIKSRQVDHDPKIRGVRTVGLQEVRFRFIPLSLAEGCNAAQIIRASGLGGGRPALAIHENSEPVSVMPPLDEGAGRLELLFTERAEAVCCGGKEDDRNEEDPVDGGEAKLHGTGIGFVPGRGGRRMTRYVPGNAVEHVNASEEENLFDQSGRYVENIRTDGLDGKWPERHLVRCLEYVQNVVQDNGEHREEESAQRRNTGRKQRNGAEGGERYDKKEGVAEQPRRTPSRELKRLCADIRGVRKEDGKGGPKFPDGNRGRMLRLPGFWGTQGIGSCKPDESVSEDGDAPSRMPWMTFDRVFKDTPIPGKSHKSKGTACNR